MKAKLKALLKQVLRRLKVLKEERNESLALKRFQLSVSNKLQSGEGRVYLVGCGTMGGQIAQAVRALDGWELPAVYDPREENALKIKNRWFPETDVKESLAALLSEIPADGILAIASTADSHVEIAKMALDLGIKKIFLEKPIGTSLSSARELWQNVEAAQAVMLVDHIRRWVPSVEGVKRLINSGIIGQVHSLHYNFGRAGMAMIGTHLFDFVRWLFDGEILSVKAHLDHVERPSWRGSQFVDHSGRVELKMDKNIWITLDLSDNMPLQQDFFVIYGATGRLEVDQRNETIRMVATAGRTWEEHYAWHHMIQVGLSRALIEINNSKPARCGPQDGYKALEAAIACYHSHRNQNAWTDLPLNGTIVEEVFPFA